MVVRVGLKGSERAVKTSAVVSGGFEAEIEVISSEGRILDRCPKLMDLEIEESRYWGIIGFFRVRT
jgi:hypothetical protein